VFNVGMEGNMVSEHTVTLGELRSPAKKLLINYNQDVLSD